MIPTWNFHSAGQLIFGWGARKRLGYLAQLAGRRKVLLVSDPNLVRVGMVDEIAGLLNNAGMTVDIFDQSEAEPSLMVAEAAAAQAREFRPDAILGLGGGSNIDLAKMTAVLSTYGGDPRQYFGWDQVPGPVTPLVALPTTAGTGSEVSQSSVLTDTEANLKVSMLSNYLRPTLALVDPELTVSCPKQVTADSGIDALTHAVEGFLARDFTELKIPRDATSPYAGSNPLVDTFAEQAIRLVGNFLTRAVEDGSDREAREQMALAATLGGLAFSNGGVAVVHALEYPIGGAVHCSHGAGNGLLLPYVMRYNLAVRRDKIARIGHWLNPALLATSTDEAAEGAIEAVEQLKLRIGIPAKLSAWGVTEEMIPQLAAKSFGITRLMTMNPRTPSEADLREILKAAL
ncbi:MAG: iron-containing alcohol dehydrogenase [Pirellulaceae bacterium]